MNDNRNSESNYSSQSAPSGDLGGFLKRYIGYLYIGKRFYLLTGACIVLFIGSFFIPALLIVPITAWYLLLALVVIDYIFLFLLSRPPLAKRITSERFSNGDENRVTLQVANLMRFEVQMDIIDELPEQFQKRDWIMQRRFKAGEEQRIVYTLRPTERGAYHFGNIILYTRS